MLRLVIPARYPEQEDRRHRRDSESRDQEKISFRNFRGRKCTADSRLRIIAEAGMTIRHPRPPVGRTFYELFAPENTPYCLNGLLLSDRTLIF
jgi:hypothetical protein